MKLSLFSTLIVLSTLVNAQIAWERPYGGIHNPNFNDVIHAPGNFFYVCGKDTLNNNTRAMLAKLDSSGNVLWEKYYTVQDSDFWFDHLIMIDSNLILQGASYAHTGGWFSVPKILKIDAAGTVLDSTWIDVSQVYNQVGNMNLHAGANHSFWVFTYIGTIGVSNMIEITRHNQNTDLIRTLNFGAFYDQRHSINKKGDMIYDVFIDEYDTITGMITNPDHISLWDSAGAYIFDSIYFNLPPSDELLRRENGDFNLFYNQSDSLLIRHFDKNGMQQHAKFIGIPYSQLFSPVPDADSGYFMVTSYNDLLTNHSGYNVYKFNSSDDTMWTQPFSNPYVSWFKAIKPTSDGGAILLFTTSLYGDSINYLIRLGPNGERFPFSLDVNPHIFCIGDTVQLSTLQPAAGYLWSTGDTTAVLNVTASGNYGLTATDSLGNIFSLHSYPVHFDSISPAVLNDVHTCQASIQLTQSSFGVTTFWSNERYGYIAGTNGYYNTNHIPDTMMIWIVQQTPGGCRTSDSAIIFFDDCLSVSMISNDVDLLLVRTDLYSINIQSKSGKNINQIYLSDLSGRCLLSQSCHNKSIDIETASFSPGIYLLKCLIDDKALNKKILIVR